MEYMGGIILIALMIICPIVGWILNNQYTEKYGNMAINWIGFAAQCVFLMLMLFTWPNPEPSGWFILWLVLTIISYEVALVFCYKQAKAIGADNSDIKKAMVAQAITPVGVAIIILIVIAAMFGAFSKSKK